MRVYATTDDGRTFLVEIACDRCGAVLKPGRHVLTSGWEKRVEASNGEIQEWHYCPKCRDKA